MSTIENGMVAGLGRHYAAQDRRAAADEAAFECLREELAHALLNDPEAQIPTPGSFAGGTAPASMIFYDALTSGRDGDKLLADTIAVLAQVARGHSGHAMAQQAAAIIDRVAVDFADFHSGDLADEMGDD